MFKKIFIKLCNEKGVAPTVVCQHIGLSNAAFSKWADDSIPRMATLQKIADYFCVTTDYLLGKEETTPFPKSSHSITIRGRDGSVIESDLTDEQIELFKQMLKQVTEKK